MRKKSGMTHGVALGMALGILALSGCAQTPEAEPEPPVATAPAPESASLSLPADLKDLAEFEVTDTRNLRFCEVILVAPGGAEAFNTTAQNDCPPGLWDSMDADALKTEFKAQAAILNGPKFWMMDSQTLWFGGPASFGGMEMNWAATLDPAGLEKEGGKPYQIFNPDKTQKMIYEAGKAVYELVDAEGHAYVLQARGERFSMEELESMGEHMEHLPEGWSYRSRVLDEDLILDLGPHMTIYGVGDEFHQYYTRIPEAD